MTDTTDKDNSQAWKTFQTVVLIVGFMATAFVAGISYGGVAATAAGLNSLAVAVKDDYVRKDGKELEQMRGQLNLLNSKVDQLLDQRGIPRR